MLETVEDVASLWAVASEKLERQNRKLFADIFSQLMPLRLEGRKLIFGVPDEFFGQWVSNNYGDFLDEALKTSCGDYSYKLCADPGYENPSPRPRAAAPASPAPAPVRKQPLRGVPRDNHQRFDNFVVGEENRYAYAAAQSVAQQSGAFNPLFIYGSTGVGKTHLLHAIASGMHEKNPAAVIRYATCEELLNDFLLRLQNQQGNMYEFRSSLRNVDILLVDDVHILGKSSSLQEEIFNTFNVLYRFGKQVVLTSDRPPCEINGLEDRLVSRFESGLTTEILRPEFESRLAILRQLRQDSSFVYKPSDEILEFIASNITASVRRLQGAFMQVIISHGVMCKTGKLKEHEHFTLLQVENLLGTLIIQENTERNVSIDDIQRLVANYFSLKVTDILSEKRPKNIAEPRMVAMFLCRKYTKHSLPEIGAAFGKNHATIINAVKKIPALCVKSDEMRRSVMQLERQLMRR